MGIILNKEEDKKDSISQRISADLSSKMSLSDISNKTPQDPAGYKATGKFGWVWFILIILAIIALISIVVA